MNSAFLSLPLTVNFDESGVFRDDRFRFYNEIVSVLQSAGFRVLSAVLNEDWGRKKLTVPEFTRFDVESILNCDLLLVVSSEGLSRDIYLEIGIALGAGIPVIILLKEETQLTYMLQGLRELSMVKVATYQNESDAAAALKRLLLR